MRNLKFTFSICSFLFLLMGCKEKYQLPHAHTLGVSKISFYSASAYGSITGMGITSKGFCWDTLDNPDLTKNHVDLGENPENFSADISNLLPSKRYYVRAYCTNSAGTDYGSVSIFSTLTEPEVFTYTPTITSHSSAIFMGNAANSYSMQLIESGVYYGLTGKPEISGSKKTAGNFSSFTLSVNNLLPNTTYYVRAYATYSMGNAYGKEISFKTPLPPVQYSLSSTMTDIDGNVYNTVTIGNQTWMAENLKVSKFNDGNPIPLVAGGFGSWTQASYGTRCNLYDNTANVTIYGYCYNFRAAMDSRIAPPGWHVPSETEWQTLFNELGGINSAFTQLIATNNKWPYATCSAINNSSMSFLPCGFRNSSGFDSKESEQGYFWTSSIANQNSNAYAYVLSSNCSITKNSYPYNTGCYIRLVKD